ncbi:TonB-dependent siderophore receptor [Pseudoxanthomonas sp.]|uniref:TonB-dependent siderophore receptor n=1 Tax=Pseudoxanthomonas sp. TaxID=1871049 RepID=UPI002586C097|nr:TonB-dependent siderophore receptor [Pseudoxanthomonas sp.]MCR6684912.1 TonB-dependent siderophore receptor [Pseudoxanthomonas sp.]
MPTSRLPRPLVSRSFAPASAQPGLRAAIAVVFVAMAAAALAAPQEARDEAGRGDARDPVTELDAVAVHGERQGLGLDTVAGQGALGARALIDTPFSVTVVDQEDIARRQAVTLGQIFINDPSVTTADAGGTTNWWGLKIRGLGVRSYYVDGVPMLMEWGGEFPVEAVESVQALKGLGGFMYGFGSPGGIVSYQLKKPTDAPLLATTFGYRTDGVFSAHVDAGGRVAGAGSPGYRINAAAEHGEAYNGAQVDRELVSLALVQPLGERLTWRFDGFHEDSRLGGEPILFYWDLYEGRRPPAPTYDYRDVSVRNAFYKTQTAHATTGLEWRINEAWSVDFSLGHSRREHYSNKMFADLLNAEGDYSGSAYNFAGVLRNTFSRLLVQGRLQTGAIGHELALGADYQRATDQWGREWYWSNDFDGNLYRPQTFLVTRDFDFSLEPVSADTRQKALFASDTLHLGRHWQAVLGLRSTDFEMLDLDGDPGYDSGYDVRATTPTAAVIYKPSARTALYASYVESLEAGSRVGETYANAGELLDATVSKQDEVGIKYDGARVGFTVAAFRVERAAQIEELREDGLRYLTQDGLTLYRGLEAIGSFGVGEDLRLGLGATWLDASIEDVSPEHADYRGNRPAGASRLQALANAEYRVPAVQGLSLHGNVRYFGDAWYADDNRVSSPSYALAGIGFQYRTTLAGRPALLTGNVNNLFDRKYWQLGALGEARNGSLSLRIDW